MIAYNDLKLPGKATEIMELLNDGLINKNDALQLLAKIIQKRQAGGVTDHPELISLMERVWNS